jgi:hypothetical protein
VAVLDPAASPVTRYPFWRGDAGERGRFLAWLGDVPVHRLKAWLKAPSYEYPSSPAVCLSETYSFQIMKREAVSQVGQLQAGER